MSSSIGIKSIVNNLDGSTVTVTLDGTPSGTLTFQGSDTPASQDFTAPYTGTGPYVVTLPYPGIWHLWAQDNNGLGARFGSVLMGYGNTTDADAIAQKVHDLLILHKPGMEAVLQTWYPGTTIKQIHAGFPSTLLDDFPSIIVTKPSWQGNWRALPLVQRWNYSLDILCFVVRRQEEPENPLATRMVEAVQQVLGLRRYVKITTSNQLTLTSCNAFQGNSDEIQIEEGLWATVGSVVWTGLATKQIGRGSF